MAAVSLCEFVVARQKAAMEGWPLFVALAFFLGAEPAFRFCGREGSLGPSSERRFPVPVAFDLAVASPRCAQPASCCLRTCTLSFAIQCGGAKTGNLWGKA